MISLCMCVYSDEMVKCCLLATVLLWSSEKMVGVCPCVQCICSCHTDFYLLTRLLKQNSYNKLFDRCPGISLFIKHFK